MISILENLDKKNSKKINNITEIKTQKNMQISFPHNASISPASIDDGLDNIGF